MLKSGRQTRGHLVPQHNELSLYLIGASMVVLLMVDPVMRRELGAAIQERNMLSIVPFCLIFFGQGLLFTFIHLFTHSRKNAYEIFCMVFFAIFVNAVAGIAACLHIFAVDCFRPLLIFPIWNMIGSLLLLASVFIAMLGGGDVQHLEVTVGEEDATPRQLVLGSVILALLIGLCQWAFGLHWAITLSICVIHASHFDRLVQRLNPDHSPP